MARIDIPVHRATRTGTVIDGAVVGDPESNHVMVNDGSTMLTVENTSTTDVRLVTFHLFRTVDGQAVMPRSESVGVGETRLFGPFPVVDYGAALEIDVDGAEVAMRALRV